MSGCPAGSAARRRSSASRWSGSASAVAAGRLQQTGQVVEAIGDARVPGGQRGPANVERLAVERLGLGGAAGRLQQTGQVVEAIGDAPGARRAARPGACRAPRGGAARLGVSGQSIAAEGPDC